MENAQTDTNGNGADNTTARADSPLKPIRAAWEAAGSKMPSKEDGDKLKAAYKAAKAKVVAADEAATAARKQLSDVCKTIMEKTGARAISFDGVVHVPSVHGQSYFFRGRGEREVTSL